MLVRKAELYDLPAGHEMLLELEQEGIKEYGLGHDRESAAAAMEMFVRHHLGVVAVENDRVIGCMGGFLTPYYLNNRSVMFQEILWYVRPDRRKTGAAMRLLEVGMLEAKKAGATHMVIAHTGKVLSKKLGQVYERLGFQVLETQYIRSLA